MSYEASIEKYLRSEVEKGKTLGPEGDSWKSATGEPFVTLCSQGIKEQGFPTINYPTPSAARDAYLGAWKHYALGKGAAVLFWRLKPRLDYNNYYDSPPGWAVYSRLLLSSNIGETQ